MHPPPASPFSASCVRLPPEVRYHNRAPSVGVASDGRGDDMRCRHNQSPAERVATRAGRTKHSCFESLCVLRSCAPRCVYLAASPPSSGYASGRSFDTAASLSPPSRSGLMMPRGNMIVKWFDTALRRPLQSAGMEPAAAS